MQSDRKLLERPCWAGQHIGVAWVEAVSPPDRAKGIDIGFKVVANFNDRKSIDFRLAELARANGPALRFVEAWGDTLFNQTQIRALVGELREIRGRAQQPDLIAHLNALIAFADREVASHSQLLFIGD